MELAEITGDYPLLLVLVRGLPAAMAENCAALLVLDFVGISLLVASFANLAEARERTVLVSVDIFSNRPCRYCRGEE